VKTTLEIPDAVLRRAKANAALQGIPLQQFVTEAVEDKLRAESAGAGSRSAAPVFSPPQTAPPVTVSPEAETFALERGLWTSLVLLKSLILGGGLPFLDADVDLVPDAEVPGQFTISFCIRTGAEPQDVLDFDESIRGLAYDRLPKDDQMSFAVRFEFV
jgi:hypothetical protein